MPGDKSSKRRRRVRRTAAAALALILAPTVPVRAHHLDHSFAWPTKKHRVSSDYGRRRGGFHSGVDLDCDRGNATRAAEDGVVRFAGWRRGYGKTTVVAHGRGVSTLYAHQSRIVKRKGAHVARGARLGSCGSTGNASGSHLHFEVRIDGHHTDPTRYLPRR